MLGVLCCSMSTHSPGSECRADSVGSRIDVDCYADGDDAHHHKSGCGRQWVGGLSFLAPQPRGPSLNPKRKSLILD